MDARAEILRRVRDANRMAHAPADGVAPLPSVPPVENVESVENLENLEERFVRELETVAARPHKAASVAELGPLVASILGAAEVRTLVSCSSPLLMGLQNEEKLADLAWTFPNGQSPSRVEEWRAACAAADAGITEVDFALADTGTLVLRARADQPGLASLLPSLHIAVVARHRLLPDIDALFAVLPATRDSLTPCLTLITGPSRTADIEKKIVLGVHGPETLHVILLGD